MIKVVSAAVLLVAALVAALQLGKLSLTTLPASWGSVSSTWPGHPNETRDDFRRLGSNTVPGLIQQVRRRHFIESPVIQQLRRKLPQKAAAFIPDTGTVSWRRQTALWLLGELGPSASNAVPELERFRDSTGDMSQRSSAVMALARIQPDNPAARSNVLRMLTSSQQTERFYAALEFGGLPCRSPEDVAPLITVLSDSDGEVRANAAHSVAQFGPLAAAAAPALRTLLDDSYRHVPVCAAYALLSVSPTDAPVAVATLTNHLGRNTDLALMVARQAFRHLGTSAAPAVPYLIHAATGQHYAWTDIALCQVSPDPPQESVDRLATHFNPALEELQVLEDLGGRASNAIPRLRKVAVQAESPTLRDAAARALSRITNGAPIRRH